MINYYYTTTGLDALESPREGKGEIRKQRAARAIKNE